MSLCFRDLDLDDFAIKSAPAFQVINIPGPIHELWRKNNMRTSIVEDEIENLQVQSPATAPDLTAWNRGELTLTDRVYNRMTPALRLATHMLRHSYPFFAKVRLAALQPAIAIRRPDYHCEEGQPRRYDDVQYLVEGFRYDANRHQATLDGRFRRIATHYRIFLRDDGADVNYQGLSQQTGVAGPCRYVTELNADFWEHFGRPSRREYDLIPREVKLRYCFDLAVTLVHELTHITWFERVYPDGTTPECCLTLRDPEVELGTAWEVYMFGGKIDHIGARETGARSAHNGTSHTAWDRADPQWDDAWYIDQGPQYWAVDGSSILSLFTASVWNTDDGRPQNPTGAPGRPFELRIAPLRAYADKVDDEPDYDELFATRAANVRNRRKRPIVTPQGLEEQFEDQHEFV